MTTSKSTPRTLENPPARLPLAPHLTFTVAHDEARGLLANIRRTVRSLGDSLAKIDHIAIAWPHKHPRDAYHENRANAHALRLKSELEMACRHISFPLASAIYETVKLGRSEDQSVLHALTGRQNFAVDASLQDEDLPFLSSPPPPRSYFIIVDWTAIQATTIANLASYLTHNGGTVLAAATGNPGHRLAQGTEKLMENNHLPPGLRAGMVPDIAAAFTRATAHKLTPAACVQQVENALKPHGRSLSTLTVAESEALINAVDNGDLSFKGLLAGLESRAAHSMPRTRPWPYNMNGG